VAVALLTACHGHHPAPPPSVATTRAGSPSAAPGTAFDFVWTTQPQGGPERLFGRRADGVTVTLGPLSAPPLDLSPDGRRLAYADGTRGVTVLTLDGMRATSFGVPFQVPPWQPPTVLWSPDGRTLAVADGALPLEPGGVERGHDASGFFLVDTATGVSTRVAYRIATGSLAWSPDGTRLAVSPPEGGVDVIGRDGTRVRRFGGLSAVGGHAWSPDGRWLLAAQLIRGNVFTAVVDATTGERTGPLLPTGPWAWRDATHVARLVSLPGRVEVVEERHVALGQRRVLLTFSQRVVPRGFAMRPAS
jgi:DNA-binding beta-propeller fold protein YncE